MRILVVGSCGKRKRESSPKSPTCKDITSKVDLATWREKFKAQSYPARDMYIGFQAQQLVNGVDVLRKIDGADVTLVIISAGFGLIYENEVIPPYDCSFSKMKKSEILDRAEKLSIQDDFTSLCEDRYDLIYLALGKNYLSALGVDWLSSSSSTIIVFNDTLAGDGVVFIPANHRIVHALSSRGYKIHGVSGFKGDLFRVLTHFASESDNPYKEIMKWRSSDYLRELVHTLSGI